MKGKKAFTLVELIIVITILSILSTIAYASYMHYTAEARNVVRIQVGKNIENGLNMYIIDKAKYPEPDIPSFEISYGEEKVGMQGVISNNIAQKIGMNSAPIDPKTKQPYFYSITKNGRNMAILGFLEESKSYQGGGKILGGRNAPIVLKEDNKEIGESIEVLSADKNDVYEVYYNQSSYTGDVYLVGSSFIGRNTSLSYLDDTLIAFWDMEPKTSKGELKDLSVNENHLEAFESGDEEPNINIIGNVEGIVGRATAFDGKSYFKTNIEGTSLTHTGTTSFLSFFKTSMDDGGERKETILSIDNSTTGTGYELMIDSAKNFKFFSGIDWTQEFETINTGFQMGGITYNSEKKMTVFENNRIITDDENYIYNSDGDFIFSNDSDFFLGAQYEDWGFFKGIIDDTRIYKRELTPGEMQFFYDVFAG